MSLHARIVGWFAFFAAVAVLAVGLGDYFQAIRGLELTLESRISSVALRAVVETERALQAYRTELVGAGTAASLGLRDSVSASARMRYSSLVVRSGSRTVISLHDPSPAAASADSCGPPTIDLAIRTTGPAGEPVEITASLRAAAFFSALAPNIGRIGERGVTAIVRLGDGALVRDFACEAGAGARIGGSLLGRLSAAGPVRREMDGVRFYALPSGSRNPIIAAVAPVSALGWGVLVAVDQGEFAKPFFAARLKYIAMIGAIILAALVLVLRGIRDDLGRLSAIARAAEDIGHGHFDVWLPPPTGDEVGRVSLALGRMVDRLSASIRQIEITRSMAAVGELATYLSHEIRNPLSSVQLNLQMLRRDLRGGEVPDDAGQLVDLSLTELSRLEGVVRAVLQLGRDARGQSLGSCPLNETVRDTVRVMQRSLDEHGFSVELRLHEHELFAGMDGAALRSVLLNLLLNSIDAMADQTDRRIIIRTAAVAGAGPAEAVAVAVRDVGPGVPTHLRGRIFDPFFTTKANGNGIGLSIALRAAQECGGVLRYAPPAEGVGAEFILELPAGAQAAAPPSVLAGAGHPATGARPATPLVPSGA